ncbi:signal transduction histidine kinase [Pedobacter cryoconitis]|uniref:sensor histidine kinase n=1 Tax=Pedobacter cryoconitis TaxID=188932 RepID=UPI0016183F8F|nr:sensor histidine kinase [Pedobacter cryoconitis]MBB6271356.1 signal transduction histidine kinase [Pedobacter cryoconitis]
MRVSLFFFLFLLSTAVFSQVITVDRNLSYQSLGKSVGYLVDRQGVLNIAQVTEKDKQGRFLRADADILNFGNSKSAFWIKISYLNQTHRKAYLVLDASCIDDIDFYRPADSGKFVKIHTGSLAPKNPEVIGSTNYIFTLSDSVYNSGVQTVYLRLKTNNILLVPLKITVSERLAGGLSLMERLESVYIGILSALFFFNLFVFIRSKDKTYFYYSVYILSLFIYMVCYFRGYGYYLGDSFRIFINTYPYVFISLGSIAGIAFSCSFLNLSILLPQSKRIIQLLMVCWLLTMLICLMGYKSYSTALVQILAATTSLVVWFLGFIAYFKGYKPALYYIIAWAFVCLTSVWVVLSFANVFVYSELLMEIAPLGFIFELLMLSLALGDRLKDLNTGRLAIQSDRLRMQEENLYLIRTQKERLEKIVESRTRSLNKIVKSLEEANNDKSRLFSIIAHDLRSPFNSLISLYSLNDLDMLSLDEVKMLLNDSRKSFDHIHNTLNNLLYWAQSQLKGINNEPVKFSMLDLTNELMQVYQPLIVKKDIAIKLEVSEDADVYADLNQINLVMRNLIDNAIKFTPLGAYISIKIYGNEHSLFIDVSNPVSGAVNIDRLSEDTNLQPAYGTSNERGVGLGLQLCRDFVERNKGQLLVSKVDGCVVLCFDLPKFRVEN